MKYSPKLKRVMSEIEAVIKENDLGAVIVLVEPGFSEHLTIIDPSFSLAKFEGSRIAISTKGKKLNPLQKGKAIRETTNLIQLLAVTTTFTAIQLQNVADFLNKQTNASHGGLTHTSQEEIDN